MLNNEPHYITGSHGFVGNTLCQKLVNYTRGQRQQKIPQGIVRIVDLAVYGNLVAQEDVSMMYDVNVARVMTLLTTVENYNSVILTSASSLQQPNHNDYTRSKGLMEQMALIFAKTTGKPICIIRPSSITGVGEQSAHLIPRLLESCIKGTEIPFVDDPVHDFVDVEDVVSAILFIEKHIEIFVGKVVNVSTNVSYSNLEVKRMVEETTGHVATVRSVSQLRAHDSTGWRVDNSLLTLAGWRPQKTLEQSLREMYADYHHRASLPRD